MINRISDHLKGRVARAYWKVKSWDTWLVSAHVLCMACVDMAGRERKEPEEEVSHVRLGDTTIELLATRERSPEPSGLGFESY